MKMKKKIVDKVVWVIFVCALGIVMYFTFFVYEAVQEDLNFEDLNFIEEDVEGWQDFIIK